MFPGTYISTADPVFQELVYIHHNNNMLLEEMTGMLHYMNEALSRINEAISFGFVIAGVIIAMMAAMIFAAVWRIR